MKKIIFRHKLVIIAAIIAFILIFFFVPFILTSPSTGTNINPCPMSALCNLSAPQTLYDVLKDNEAIISVGWYAILIIYLIIFAIVFGELKLLIYAMKPQKKTKTRADVIKKILALAAFVVIPIIVISFVLNFFGLSLSI